MDDVTREAIRKVIEETYSQAVYGTDEPDVAIGPGKTFKFIDPEVRDRDGNALEDDVTYIMTRKGIERYV